MNFSNIDHANSRTMWENKCLCARVNFCFYYLWISCSRMQCFCALFCLLLAVWDEKTHNDSICQFICVYSIWVAVAFVGCGCFLIINVVLYCSFHTVSVNYFAHGRGAEVLWWPSVCLFVCLHQIFMHFTYMSMAWSFSGSVVMHYVLPVT